jgi:hypothetical protein
MGASPSTTITRTDLSILAMAELDLAASREGFIGKQVFPISFVGLQAASPGKIPIEALLAEADTQRSAGSGYARSNFKFATWSYATQEHGKEEVVDDRQAAMYRNEVDALMYAVERSRDVVLRNFERRVAAAVFDSATWTGAALTTAVATEWSTKATAAPIDNVLAAAAKVRLNCGMTPNTLILGWTAWQNLRECAQILDRIRYGGAPSLDVSKVGQAAVAQILGLNQILVGGAVKNSANPGQTASLADCWDDEYAMVAYIDPSPDLARPTLGKTIIWTEEGSPDGIVETYRDETVRGEVVRFRWDSDEVVMYAECGHLLSNITA